MTRLAAVIVTLLVVGPAQLAGPAPVLSQTAIPSQKTWTPEQKQAQGEYAKYEANRAGVKLKAQQALAAETAREKADDCPGTQSNYEWEICLTAQSAKTQANYAEFAGALRSMLGMHGPTWPGEPPRPVPGPEGTPPTPEQEVAAFDRIEQESRAYREHAGKIAFQQFQGGTLAPVFEAEAEQKLLRLHMQELAFVYGEMLSNH